MKNAYSTYKTANVDTADQGKLILIAYDVAIKHCKFALDKFDENSMIEERTKHLFKVQDAISELMSSLKMDVGEISKNLYQLYDYMIRQLISANTHQEPASVKEVLGYLTDLRSAWNDAIKSVKSNTAVNFDAGEPRNIAMVG